MFSSVISYNYVIIPIVNTKTLERKNYAWTFISPTKAMTKVNSTSPGEACLAIWWYLSYFSTAAVLHAEEDFVKGTLCKSVLHTVFSDARQSYKVWAWNFEETSGTLLWKISINFILKIYLAIILILFFLSSLLDEIDFSKKKSIINYRICSIFICPSWPLGCSQPLCTLVHCPHWSGEGPFCGPLVLRSSFVKIFFIWRHF